MNTTPTAKKRLDPRILGSCIAAGIREQGQGGIPSMSGLDNPDAPRFRPPAALRSISPIT